MPQLLPGTLARWQQKVQPVARHSAAPRLAAKPPSCQADSLPESGRVQPVQALLPGSPPGNDAARLEVFIPTGGSRATLPVTKALPLLPPLLPQRSAPTWRERGRPRKINYIINMQVCMLCAFGCLPVLICSSASSLRIHIREPIRIWIFKFKGC